MPAYKDEAADSTELESLVASSSEQPFTHDTRKSGLEGDYTQSKRRRKLLWTTILLPWALATISTSALVINWASGHAYTLNGQPAREAAAENPLVSFQKAWQLTNQQMPSDKVKTLPSGLSYREPKPDQVCIMSSDTRAMTPFPYSLEQQNHREPPTATEIEYYDAAVYHNMFWALRHGYRFQRWTWESMTDRWSTWQKFPAIGKSLETCEYVVFLDGDAVISHPQYSLFELMKHFGFHDRASMALAMDIPLNEEGNINATNTGFMLFRNTPTTLKVIDQIWNCFDHFPGCRERFSWEWPHEQGAFNRYVRPTLKEGEELVIVPCVDANGWPDNPNELENVCQGAYISHWWGDGKEILGKYSNGLLIGELLHWLQSTFEGNQTRLTW